jgi:hypothetical protein
MEERAHDANDWNAKGITDGPPIPQHPSRIFEGSTYPCDISAQQLATIVNFAIRVGRGTGTLKALGELVAPLGVRRVK